VYGPAEWVGCFNNSQAETQALANHFVTSIAHPYVPPPCVRRVPDQDRTIPRPFTGQIDLSAYERNEWLDMDMKYRLFWTANETSGDVKFAALVNTTGWIGLGISPNGGMQNSDMMMTWLQDKDGHGTLNFSDRHAPEKRLPRIDVLQDFYDITAVQFPVGAPATPLIDATHGDSLVMVHALITNDGGLPITQLVLTATPVTLNTASQFGAVPDPIIVVIEPTHVPFSHTFCMMGLTNGKQYTFAVSASNPAGNTASIPTPPITPATLADAPVNMSGVAGDTTMILSWSAPYFNGGRAVTNYTIMWMNSNTTRNGTVLVPATGVPVERYTVRGLTNFNHYTIIIQAVTMEGVGRPSEQVQGTPFYYAPDGLPLGIVLGVMGGVVALGVVVYLCWRRSKARASPTDRPHPGDYTLAHETKN